ncbi:MAG: hypothetical protein ACREBD_40420 [Blastocatellia bacterium]
MFIGFLIPRPEASVCAIAVALALAVSRAGAFADVASIGAWEAGEEAAGFVISVASGEMAAVALPRLRSAVTAVLLRLSGAVTLWAPG